MISEDALQTIWIPLLRQIVSGTYLKNERSYEALMEIIDLIPLGWQVANNQEDSRVGVALESDDSD